ncbi:universal stress protein [Chryseosolibacter indicus]|uniref:UspA domain-containing protein n=1 Tax=Chryseosolibacter indicus TaxID=2782351 RepID=A0ABS5VSX7_9BACT|nr:universal stress protein [Chryseosolibacter indicus]MBT1703912.1 hypothetical protein [Chryseosolibacter indicus]
MKNILIATTYQADTLQALKIAADFKRKDEGNIILLSISEVSDSITDLLFLSSHEHIDQNKRSVILSSWNEIKRQNNFSASLEEHHQFGMSRPILDQLLQRFNADMVIVPLSFQHSKQYIHKLVLKLLHKSECPMMLLPEEQKLPLDIQRALFLDQVGQPLTSSIQNLPFHIIHQSMVNTEHTEDQSLKILIEKLSINLIVQAKRKSEIAEDNSHVVNLGLPVLAV